MFVDFNILNDKSRIWIYASESMLNDKQQTFILNNISNHLQNWNAHQLPLKAGVKIFENHFIVVALDESLNVPSGCSIDTLHHTIHNIEKELEVSLINRMVIFCVIKNTIKCIPIDKLSKGGDPNKFKFSKPSVKDLNFSFSGLKTNFKNFILKQPIGFVEDNLSDLCASIQSTIVNILIDKIKMARDKHGINEFVICGGVSANSFLRKKLNELEENDNINTYVPKVSYSTDNAAMIGINGYFKFKNSIFGKLSDYSISKYPIQ